MRRGSLGIALLVPMVVACVVGASGLGVFSRSIIMFQPRSEASNSEKILERLMADYETYLEHGLDSRVVGEYRTLFYGLVVEFGSPACTMVERMMQKNGIGSQKQQTRSALTKLLRHFREGHLLMHDIDLIVSEDGLVHAVGGAS